MRRPDGIKEKCRHCNRSSQTNVLIASDVLEAIAAGFRKPGKDFGVMPIGNDFFSV